MEEKRIEKMLVREIGLLGGKAYKFISPGAVGVPDRIVLLPEGRICFVELKSPGKKLRTIQEYRKKEIENLGFKVLVIDSIEKVKDFIKEVQVHDI